MKFLLIIMRHFTQTVVMEKSVNMMHLKTKVKAEAINNLSDARYFAAMGVSWLGFSLDLSKKTNLEPETIREIIQWVQGPKIVGEFGLQPESHILEMAEQLELDYIQIP